MFPAGEGSILPRNRSEIVIVLALELVLGSFPPWDVIVSIDRRSAKTF
jgi:hypothetical protein